MLVLLDCWVVLIGEGKENKSKIIMVEMEGIYIMTESVFHQMLCKAMQYQAY